MTVHNFFKTKLVFNVSRFISDQRETLLADLVAYSNDPVRYMRRLRMLSNLAEYEFRFLDKMRNFEPDEINDYDLIDKIKIEVESITNIYA